jgi:predicted ATPase
VITRIQIDGYKSFEDFDLELSPFSVLVGANASGKSNLLEALDLLAHLVREPTGQTLVDHARRGGPKELFRRVPDGAPVPEMRIAADVLSNGDGGIGYCHLRVEARVRYADPPDPLCVDVTVENVHDLDEYNEDGVLSAMRDRLAFSGSVREELARTGQLHATPGPVQDSVYGPQLTRDWRIVEPLPRSMRLVSSTFDEAALAEDGKNLGAVLGRLSRHSEQWFDFMADAVALLPELTDVAVEANREWAQWDVWLEHKHEPRMSPNAASAGTLRVLALFAAAYDPAHPGLLMLEEPENGLYPGRVPQLLARLRGRVTDLGTLGLSSRVEGAAQMRQIMVTSHSPVALAAALEEAPDAVVFFDTVTRFGDGHPPRRVTRARRVADSGERGTFVTPVEVRKYLDPVGRFARGA